MNEFQERLQELLIQNDLSRLSLSKKLSISSTTINDYFNKSLYPQIDIALKMANYFNCSLDFLLGLSDEYQNNIKNDKSFIETFDELKNSKNIPIAKIMKELKMSEYNYYRWKNGLFPRTYNLIDIAKYFNISVDYLVGNFKK